MAQFSLTLLHSERPKLYTILAFQSAIGLRCFGELPCFFFVLFCFFTIFSGFMKVQEETIVPADQYQSCGLFNNLC